MVHPALSPEKPSDYPGRVSVSEFFSAHAADLDRVEEDVRPGLRFLGERGLLDLGAPDNAEGGFAAMLLLVEDVASECMSSAFALWGQRMVVEYLGHDAQRPETARKLSALRAGTLIGSTAMAPAMKHVAGIEPAPVVATRTADGVLLNGPIRWASNLFEGSLVVVPARYADGGGVVVHLYTDDPGVEVHSAPELLALGSTGSTSVTLTDVEVPAAAVLSEDLTGFVRSIRPALLLLQSAFCSGLAGASRHHAGSRLTGLNAGFIDDFDELARRHDSVRDRLFGIGKAPQRAESADLPRLRLDAARVAVDATRLESTVAGGGGYVAGSATSRRLREAAFLPVHSPTEAQLRWELSRSA